MHTSGRAREMCLNLDMLSASGIWVRGQCTSQSVCFSVKYVHFQMAISVKFLFLWVLSYQLDSDPNKTGSSEDGWLFTLCHQSFCTGSNTQISS